MTCPILSPDQCPVCGCVEFYYWAGQWVCWQCQPAPVPPDLIERLEASGMPHDHAVQIAAGAGKFKPFFAPPDTRPVIYMAGYAGRTVEALFETAKSLNAIIADIRLKPYSKWDRSWNHDSLRARFGRRYRHIPDLGNLAYGSGEVELANEDRGLETLLSLPHTPIMLCACRWWRNCHRSVVAASLDSRGYRAQEIEWIEARRAA